MKPSIRFYAMRERNTCQHGQKILTKWWQFDWLVFKLNSERPLLPGKTVRIHRGRRLWLYTWWGSCQVDLLVVGQRPLTRKEAKRLREGRCKTTD